MPASLDVNWTEIRQKYEAGMSFDALSEAYGVPYTTIAQRKCRQGWLSPTARNATKTAATAIKRQIAAQVRSVQPAITQAIQEWTERTHEVAGKFIRKVSTKVEECEDPEDLQRLAGTLERADTVGRRALGLDKDTPSGPAVVNIAIGLAYRPSSTSGGLVMDYAQQADAQVVDVEPASDPVN
jgi:hypothetical protein